jgi:hypothetical protein
MSWIAILGIVVVIVALFTITGGKVKGGRPAASTHLMTAARICLGLIVVVLILVAVGAFK